MTTTTTPCRGCQIQECLVEGNTATPCTCVPPHVEHWRQVLIEAARIELAPFPQYGPDYHADWIVVTVHETVRFKGSSTLVPGTWYLAAPQGEIRMGDMATWTVYDQNSGHHVGCPPEHLRRVT